MVKGSLNQGNIDRKKYYTKYLLCLIFKIIYVYGSLFRNLGKSGFGELSNANDEWMTYGVRFM